MSVTGSEEQGCSFHAFSLASKKHLAGNCRKPDSRLHIRRKLAFMQNLFCKKVMEITFMLVVLSFLSLWVVVGFFL